MFRQVNTKYLFDIKFRIAIRHSNTSKFATGSTILKNTEIIKFHFYINIKTSSRKNKMKKARTSVSLCQNSPTVFQPRIQNQEISAFTIKFEAYSHFLEMVSKNQQKLISSYTNSMLEQYELFKQFDRSSQQDTQKVEDQTKCSLLNNSMFMLKIQNQKLRCKEKLLQQKLECQKILFRKRRQEGGFLERERRMKIEEIRLLKEEVTALQSIIQKKKSLQIAQGRQRCLMAYLPMVKDIVKQYSPEDAEKLLLKILSELQNQQIN